MFLAVRARWESGGEKGQEILFHPHLAPAATALSVTAAARLRDYLKQEHGQMLFLRKVAVRFSRSSAFFGQSCRKSRERLRSASSFPPVWQ